MSTKRRRNYRDENLRRRYGITARQWDQAYDQQDGNCANPRCSNRITDVDHDHQTGQFRGLLCSDCNRALGAIHDDTEVLRGLIDYLIERKSPWKVSPSSDVRSAATKP